MLAEAVPTKLPAKAAAPACTGLQFEVGSLGAFSAELFATKHAFQGLQALPAGAKILVLSDGKESKSAGSLAIDHPHLDIYSADYFFPDQLVRVDFWGVGYSKIKIDHRIALDYSVIGLGPIKFDAVLMLKGLCNHEEWKDKQGANVGPVGCGGVALSAAGVSSFLAGIAPLMADRSRLALHGDINLMDHQAAHQALCPEVQKAIIAGVKRFNAAFGAQMANVWVGDTGLVITGEKAQALTQQQLSKLKLLVDDYFSQDRMVVCEKYRG